MERIEITSKSRPTFKIRSAPRLVSLSFETITDFYIKKTIIEAVKEKHKLTNGSNGVTDIELINLLKWKDIQKYLNELESKNIIKMQKGINSNMYFLAKK